MEALDGEGVPGVPGGRHHVGDDEGVALRHAGLGEGRRGAASVGVEDRAVRLGERLVGAAAERREPERAGVEVEVAGLVAEPLGEGPARGLPPQGRGPAVVGAVGVAETRGEGDGVGTLDPDGAVGAPAEADGLGEPGDLERPVAWRLGAVREHAHRGSQPSGEHEEDANRQEYADHREEEGGAKLARRGATRLGHWGSI